MTKDNNLLGRFNLEGLPPAPRGVPQVEVSFDIDENCIMQVSAICKQTGKAEKIVIRNDKGRLSKEEIDKLLKDAERYKDDDLKTKARVEARNSLEHTTYTIRNQLK